MGFQLGGGRGTSKSSLSETSFLRPFYEDPRAQEGINALVGLTKEDPRAASIADFYRSQIEGTAGENSYIHNLIGANEATAKQQFGENLAQVRSGGYRGGAGRDVLAQGETAQQFTNQLAADRAKLLSEDYYNRQQRGFTGAAGLNDLLNSLAATRGGSAGALLQALRGEHGTRDAIERSRQSNLGFGFSFGGGAQGA